MRKVKTKLLRIFRKRSLRKILGFLSIVVWLASELSPLLYKPINNIFSGGYVLAAETTYDTGSGTYDVPAGTTTLVVECWGGGGGGAGGGGGNSEGNGGGGGGEYAISSWTAPAASYSYSVGTAGAGGQDSADDATSGGNSTFGGTVVVATGGGKGNWVNGGGGTGGAGGTGGTGDTTYNGGNGATGTTGYGGGGGGAAGSTAAGSNASTYIGGAGASENGGRGGNGFNGLNGSGDPGSNYGGGGGASVKKQDGAAGAGGYIRINAYAPATVTTQAVSDVSYNTATGNGNITATGDRTVTRRGFCYVVGDAGDCTVADSTVYEDGSYGTGPYTLGLTGLSSGTGYRVRAYAINQEGTSYGTTVQLDTLDYSPEVELDSPLTASSAFDDVPSLLFTGSDPEGDDIRYYLQLDKVDTFDGGDLRIRVSGSNPGFVNAGSASDTDPFANSHQITYTVPGGQELGGGTWYWRVRGIDPSGSDTYGSYSDIWNFVVLQAGVTMEGTLYLADESSPYLCDTTGNVTVNVRVDGGGSYSGTCTTDDGAWQATGVVASSGQTIYAYASGGSYRANTVVVTDGTATNDVHLFQDRVILRDDVNGSITDAEILAGNTADGDDLITTSGTDVVVGSSYETHIYTGDTFVPGDNVSTGKLHVVGNYTGSTETLTLTGSGTGTSRPLYINGGTFVVPATIDYEGTGDSSISAITYENLTFSPTISGSAAYTFLGASSANGDFYVNPTAASSQSLQVYLGGTLTVAPTKTVTLTGTTSGESNLDTVSGSNYSLSTGLLDIAASGTLTAQNSGITLTGTSGIILTRTGTFSEGNSTVTYSQTTGGTTLTSGEVTFYNLTIDMSGQTGATGNNVTVGGDLTVTAGTMSVPSTYTLSVTGNTDVTGDLTISSSGAQTFTGTTTINTGGTLTRSNASGTNTFTGLVTVAGGTFTTSNDPAFTFQGGLTNEGTFTSGVGTYTFDTGNQSLSGSAPISFGGTVAISGAITLQNANTGDVTVTGDMTGTVGGSTYQNNSGNTTDFKGAVLTTGTLDATLDNNTIKYSATPTQNIKATTYHDLSFTPTLSGSAAYTFLGATSANGDFTMNPTAASANTLEADLGGAFTVAPTGTITLTGTTNGNSVLDTVSGSDYAITSGLLDITTDGRFTANNSTITLTGTSGTIFTQNGTFTIGNSTVIYSQTTGDTTLTSGAVDFYNLTVDMSGRTGSTGGNIGVGNDLTVSSGTMSVASTHTLSVTGNTSVTGHLSIPSTGAQTFTGTTTINDSGTLTRANATGSNTFTGLVTIYTTGAFDAGTGPAITLQGGLTNNGTFTSGSGTYTFDTSSQVLAGSAATTFYGDVAISGVITVENSSSNNTTVSGDLTGTVGGSTYQNNANTTTYFKGAVLSTGTLTATASPNNIYYTGTSAQTVKSTTYHHLYVQPSANSVTSLFNSGTVTVNGNLVIGNGTNTGVVVEATTNDPNISVTGDVTVNADTTLTNSDDTGATLNIDGALTITGIFTAPSGTGDTAFTLAGNFTNNGTFNHGSGQLTLDTTGTSELAYTGDTTFYQLSVLAASAGKNVKFDNAQTTIIANDITIQGTDCTTGRILLDSTVNDDTWEINIQTGATHDIDYIDLEDALGTGSEETPTAVNATQTGTNTGWTVTPGACPANVNLSGTIYQTDEGSAYLCATNGTLDITIKVDGAGLYSGSCAADTGAWSAANVPVSDGNTLYIYLSSGPANANTVLVTDATTQSDVHIMEGRVTLRDDNNGSITDAEILAGNTGDADDLITTAGTDVVVGSSYETHIYTGDTFVPGDNVTTGKLHVVGNYTGSTETLTLTGSGTGTSRPLYINGGTFTVPATIDYEGSSDSSISAITYENLTFTPTISGSAAYTFLGATSANGDFNINPTAASAQALTVQLGGTLTVAPTKTITLTGTTSGESNLDTVSGSNYAISTGFINVAAAGTLTAQNSAITLTGTSGTIFTRAGTFTPGGSTVTYSNSTGGTTLTSGEVTFYNLTVDMSGQTGATGNNVTVGGDLTVTAGTMSVPSTYTLSVTGNTDITGDLTLSSSGAQTFTGTTDINTGGTLTRSNVSGTNTFTGLVTVAGGTFTTSNDPAFTFQGGLTNEGTFTSGAGTYTFDTGSQSLSGSAPISFGGDVAISGAVTIQNANTGGITVTGDMTGSEGGSTYQNNSSTTTDFKGAVLSTGTLNATADNNTVEYSGTPTQNIKATTYHDLSLVPVLSGSAAYTFLGATSANGDFTMNPTAASANTLEADLGGALTLTPTGTITLTGTTNGASVLDTVSGSNYAITSGLLDIATDGTLTANNSSITLTGTTGTIFTKNGTFTPGNSTVTYSQTTGGTTLTSGAVDFHHLTIDMSGQTGTSGGNIGVAGDLTVTAGEMSVGSTHTLSVTGATSVTGDLTIPSSGNQTFTGATTINDSGTLTRSDTNGTNTFTGLLTIAVGGTFTAATDPAFTLQGGLTNQGTFTSGAGTYTFDTNNQVLSGSAATTFQGDVAISGAVTIENSNTDTVTVTGDLTGSEGGSTYQNNANTTTDFKGAVLATGTLTATASPNNIYYTGTSAQTVKATTYHHLYVQPSSDSVTSLFGSGTLTVNGNLEIGNGTNTAVVVEATTNDPDVSVTGNVTVNANTTLTNSDDTSATLNIDGALTITGIFTAPSGTNDDSFTLAGNFTNNGTFNHGSGQITLDTAGTSALNYSGDTTFYQFSVLAASAGKNVQFDNAQTTIIANDITIQGTDCTTGRIFLDSTVNDDTWEINIQTGSSQDIDYIDLEDALGTGSEETPLAVNATQTGTNTDWTVTPGACPVTINLSGTVYQTDEGTAYLCDTDGNLNVTLKIDGSGSYSGTCSLDTGAWSISSVDVTDGQTLYIYLSSSPANANTVLITDATTQTDVHIMEDRVTLRDDNNGTITNAEISAGNTADSDDLISFSGSDITVGSGYEVHIYTSDTYAPGANVTTGKLHVVGNYTGSTETLTLTGSGTGTSRPLYINGGTFTVPATIDYKGTGTTSISAITYENLTFTPTITGATTYTFLGASSANGDFTINPTAASANTLTVNLAGALNVADSKTLSITGTTLGSSILDTIADSDYGITMGSLSTGSAGTLNLRNSTVSTHNNWANSGTINAGSSTVNFNGTGAQQVSGTTTFYNVSFTTSSARAITFVQGSVTAVGEEGSLTFQGADSQLLTLQSSTSADWYLQVAGTAETTVTYVDVSYSNAGGYKKIMADDGTNTDSDNNTNWVFISAVLTNFEGVDLEGINVN
ncbi:hypothetical protein ACFLZ4_00905 [Patescibacteria group bacterium]